MAVPFTGAPVCTKSHSQAQGQSEMLRLVVVTTIRLITIHPDVEVDKRANLFHQQDFWGVRVDEMGEYVCKVDETGEEIAE